MKVLVTGSSGHLGEAMVRHLRSLDAYDVVSTDIIPSEFTDHLGSIADAEHVNRIVQGIEAVVHCATLHKPHIVSHTNSDFVDTNITGTLNLLEASASNTVKSFVFTSSTTVFGDALVDKTGPATWITEDVVPTPKNIYGVTKKAAEEMCQLFHRNKGLNVVVLRTSRFFLEDDDNEAHAVAYEDMNAKTTEFLYRRADIQDIVDAHVLALEKAPLLGFARYIISAPPLFSPADVHELKQDAPAVVKRLAPEFTAEFARRGWEMMPSLDRVYDSSRAVDELGWSPNFTFRKLVRDLASREVGDSRVLSAMHYTIGKKSYYTNVQGRD